MIRLDTTTRKLQALLGGSITTNQLPITVCYSDKTATAYTGGTTVINTNNTTAVDICAAPAASTVRDIDTINVNNADTVAATITIRYNDNGTTYTLFKATLATGDQLTYVHGVGWNVIDSTGKTKVGAGVNGPSSSTDNALVRWDGTAGTAIQNSGWTLSDTDALNGSSGSVGAPSLTLNSETTSGLYRIGANNHGWAISGAKVLDISSTGLGVTGSISGTATGSALTLSGATTNNRRIDISNTGGSSNIGVESSAGGAIITGSTAYATVINTGNSTPVQIGVNSVLIGSFSSTGLAVTGTLSSTGSASLGDNAADTHTILGAVTATNANNANSLNLTTTSQSSGIHLWQTNAVDAGTRNWGIFTNYAAYGDLVFRISTARYGDPDAAGSTIAAISSTGLAVTGTLSATGDATLGTTGNGASVLTTLAGYSPNASNGSYGRLLFNANNNYTGNARLYLVTNALNATDFAIIRSVDANTTPTLNSSGVVTSGTTDFKIDYSGSVTITSTGPHAIGGATAASSQLYLRGSFTAVGATATGFEIGTAMTVDANASAYGLYVAPTLIEAGSGTHSEFVSAAFFPPTITGGSAALTNASTLKITGAPTGATNNYALWVDAGKSRFDSNLWINQNADGYQDSNSLSIEPDSGSYIVVNHATGSSSGNLYAAFGYGGGGVGSITQNGTTAVAYNTTSDYRLKNNVRPADAASFKNIQFRDFEWVDGRHDCGVIAHELQAIYPSLVVGEKDAVDENGTPIYQQINYTGLIARIGTVTQQLIARIEALEATLH